MKTRDLRWRCGGAEWPTVGVMRAFIRLRGAYE